MMAKHASMVSKTPKRMKVKHKAMAAKTKKGKSRATKRKP